MRIVWISLVAVLLCGTYLLAEEAHNAGAEENPEAARQRIKAAKLIAELGSDEFGTREAAEKTLTGMGAPVLPMIKDALANTKDTEAKTRLDRICKVLSLEGETDPDRLAKLAREEATAKRYGVASKYYAKAADQYAKQAQAETDEAKKKDLTAKAAASSKRKERADGLAQNETVDENGDRVIVQKQGNAQVMIRIQGNGGQVQIGGVGIGAGTEPEAGEGETDW